MSIEGQDHFFTIYFPGIVCLVTRSRYQVSVYRTIGPQVVDGVSIQIVHVFDCQGGAGSPLLNDICQR